MVGVGWDVRRKCTYWVSTGSQRTKRRSEDWALYGAHSMGYIWSGLTEGAHSGLPFRTRHCRLYEAHAFKTLCTWSLTKKRGFSGAYAADRQRCIRPRAHIHESNEATPIESKLGFLGSASVWAPIFQDDNVSFNPASDSYPPLWVLAPISFIPPALNQHSTLHR